MRFIETTRTERVKGVTLEYDKGGNMYTPHHTARMVLKVPEPMSEFDIVKLWDAFSDELRTVTGYTEEMRERVEKKRAVWDQFKRPEPEQE